MTKWKTGDADEFLEDIMKPARLQKLEAYWEKRLGPTVHFHEQDAGYWCVDIEGCFADFELHEIVKALKAVNKAGKL